jgi:MFS family permease
MSSATPPELPVPSPPSAPSVSIWHTLRHRAFRGLWISSAVYFVGNAMQTMAAAWLMVELTGSSFLAALVQTAVFLPMFLLALPAGVLADTTDRRRLILGALAVQACVGALLALLLGVGFAGPATLLILTFCSGCCTALLSPAWNSSINDVVPREELPQAITTISIAYNAARAVGPAMAGFVFAHGGSAWNFALAVLSTLLMLQAIRRWPPKPHPPSRLPAERLWGGILSALRFARHSETVLAQLVRTMAFSATGSALWALLPIIGQRQLGLGAAGVGLLMGCMGTGAVMAGLVIGRVRAKVGIEALVLGSCVVFALAMVAAALSQSHIVVYGALVVAGSGWMCAMSTFNTATQTSVPPWVRARAMALHTLSALGAFAIGSAFWGAVADVAGFAFALCVAASAMASGVALAKPFPLRVGEKQAVTQAIPWDDISIQHVPNPEDGPVAVELSYRIRADEAAAFMEAISQLRAPRRRDGATIWRVYRDLADPSRYVERFIVTSWADYLHQRVRTTEADHALETQVRAFLQPGESVTMQHYLAEA